ncbi:hypothetical protein GVX82_01125 [Patescibacteria group bacterium]|jgi:oligoribonuclease NrnB/cAMP/cGMP phosphodiesterase (DHH superfamily)|nr:hypothetical protein [Patescibacteria group bacterium]
MEHTPKDTVVIYHAQCTDGFGAAYAAWKKFGESASYIPLKTQVECPEGLTGKTLYILDYSFDHDTLLRLRERNDVVVVIDHHASAEAAVTSFPENVFAHDHSGAVLAWQYFHKDTEVPELLRYVEDHDLWRFALPDNRAFNAALGLYEYDLATWDRLTEDLRDPHFRAQFIERGEAIAQFEDRLVDQLLTYRERVHFAGHEVWALNASRTYRSILGHRLASLNEEVGGIALGIVYYRNQGGVHISLRSNGDVDVAALAQKYGGGGHKNAASIRVPSFADLPFSYLEERG